MRRLSIIYILLVAGFVALAGFNKAGNLPCETLKDKHSQFEMQKRSHAELEISQQQCAGSAIGSVQKKFSSSFSLSCDIAATYILNSHGRWNHAFFNDSPQALLLIYPFHYFW